MKKTIFQLILFCFISNVSGQNNMLPCATHIMTKKEFDKNPALFLKNKQKLDSITNIFNNNKRTGEPEKIIPVVFHILHEGGPIGLNENISKEQVKDAIRLMNEDFNAENEDLDNIISDFQGIIGDCGVTYKLARIDPNGNCTEGITRTYWEGTSAADDDARGRKGDQHRFDVGARRRFQHLPDSRL